MTSYTVVALCVIAMLLIGIRPGAWGVLRLILAVHLLGDVLFGWVWALWPTYAFMKYIDDPDRIYAALFVAGAVGITDLTYRLSRRIGRLIAARFGHGDEAGDAPVRAFSTPGFASAFLVAGLVCKLIFLGATGAHHGRSSVIYCCSLAFRFYRSLRPRSSRMPWCTAWHICWPKGDSERGANS